MRRGKWRCGYWLLVAYCFVAIPGCASQPSPVPDSPFAAESARARATLARMIEATNAGDLAGVVDCFEAEAILLPPTGEPVRGRAGIEEHHRGEFARGRLEVKLEIDESMLARTTATLRGRATGRRVTLDGGAVSLISDAFTATLRRAPDRVWRVISLEWKNVR